jgi:hypothetical protein
VFRGAIRVGLTQNQWGTFTDRQGHLSTPVCAPWWPTLTGFTALGG